MDTEETRQAYLRALGYEDIDALRNEHAQLKADYEALQQRHNRVLDALQSSVEAILRIAREGKTDS